MHFRSILLAAAGLAVVVASSASAMDLPRKPYPQTQQTRLSPDQYVAANWDGFYVGINGGVWGTAKAAPLDWSNRGGLVGGTVGYNWQIGYVVLGLEGDFDYSSAHGSLVSGVDSRLQWLSTARGRVGYTITPSLLLYGTGGAAFAKGKLSVAGVSSDSKVHTGYGMGGGAEYAFGDGWSAKAEYLYINFGDRDYCIAGICGPGSFDAHVVRAGINYRF